MATCVVCGAVRMVPDGGVFPAHPDVSFYPVFRWCPTGDMSGVIVGECA